MLDKWLCKLAGISPFIQWLISELDDLEDLLYSESVSEETKAAVKIKYDALISVRDKYCELHKDTNNISR